MSVISNSRSNPQASDIAVQTALPMVGSASREDGQTVLSNIDSQLSKLFMDKNISLVGGGTLTYATGSLTLTSTLQLKIPSTIASI